jgi:PAS domain S-box-containing protein
VVSLLLLVIGAELVTEFRRGRELRAAVDHSYETRTQIQKVFSLLQDAETGQRGYIITGDRQFLQPYERAVRDLDGQMATLDGMLTEDAAQEADFQKLGQLVKVRQQAFVVGMKAGETTGVRSPALLAASRDGKVIMDRIRVVVDRMITREAAGLARRSQESAARTAQAERLVVGLFAILLVVVGTTVFVTWRYARTRQQLLGRIEATLARQQAVFDSAIDAIITLNPSGSIESINAAGEAMFGYSASELDRRDVSMLIDLAENGEGSFLSRLGASQGALQHGLLRELTARRRDGETFPADVALGAMELPTGVHVVAVVRDISERRRMEQMKDEFVSTVSHELRTPMTSIAGSLGLLAAGAAGELPDKAVRLIGIAQANSQRLVRLINDILDIEKIESGKLQLELKPLDLREIAERSIEGVKGFADQHGVAINFEPGLAAPVRGDSDRLIQVVTNMLSNACKFSPTGGEVAVSVNPETRLARLSVVDHGPGIPDGFRARIFSKFAQADGSDSRSKGGTGLGLAIAREIAERHGGRLWFESTPGEGATFHLDLPLAAGAVSEALLDGPRLLIVEDDADAAEVLREMLERDGLSADVTPTARDALAAARGGVYAAVLVDLQLPDADGIGLIRALRASRETRDLPVVVVSADVARGKARGRTLEVVDWMEKPFDQDRLRSAVAAMLASSVDRKPVVLQVDDDRDILQVTASALSGVADVEQATSLSTARAFLARRTPDLVILDLGLPDGSGLDLLADLGDEGGRATPVVVYSAQDMDAALGSRVDAVLTKSRTSLASLARTVRRLANRKQEAPS